MKLTTVIVLGAAIAALVIYWQSVYAFLTRLVEIVYLVFRGL